MLNELALKNDQISLTGDGNDVVDKDLGLNDNALQSDTFNGVSLIGDGIALAGSGTQVCGNAIGFGVGNQNAGNRTKGVRIDGGGNIVGHPAAGCSGNAIEFNVADGVQITGDASTLQGNTSGG